MAAVPVSAPPPRQLREEFPVFRCAIYLNSCSLGALSPRSRARVNEYLDLGERRRTAAWYDVGSIALAELRDRYALVIEAATPIRHGTSAAWARRESSWTPGRAMCACPPLSTTTCPTITSG